MMHEKDAAGHSLKFSAMNLAPITLAGQSLKLEPLGPEHRAGLARAADDPSIFRYVSADLTRPAELDAWLERAAKARDAGRELAFAIIGLADKEVMGSARYMNIEPRHRRLEIGWIWLARKRWGGPYAIECNLLLLAHAFEALKCHRVEYRTDVLNFRSQRMIEGLGARREGLFRRHMVMQEGRVRDTLQYALIDEDWPQAKARLKERLARRLGPPP